MRINVEFEKNKEKFSEELEKDTEFGNEIVQPATNDAHVKNDEEEKEWQKQQEV